MTDNYEDELTDWWGWHGRQVYRAPYPFGVSATHESLP